MNRFSLGISFLIILFLLIFSPVSVLAQAGESTVSAKLKSGGSFELFWPLTAGKTMDNPTYFLKSWKEQIQGMLIFNASQKADYEVKLTTKRILEAEKLIKEGKDKLALQTLDKALANLSLAQTKFSKSKKSGNDFQKVKINLINQLSNLDIFLPALASLGKDDFQSKNNQVKELVENFLSNLK